MNPTSANPETGPDSERYRWYVLSLLVSVYMVHHLDRQVVSLLMEPIRTEFALSDTQLGLLAGTAYAVAFAISGIPLGLLADRVHRVRLLSLLLGVWSGLTALSALAGTFVTLVLIRIGIGAAESGGTPVSLSLLSDYFDRRRRSTATGIYMMGTQLGTIVGFAVAGVIAARYGWRAGFLAAGLPGVMLATLMLFTLREPRRGQSDESPAPLATAPATTPPSSRKPPLGEVVRYLKSRPALVHMIVGVTIANTVAAGVTLWLPALLMRTHGVGIQTAGLSVAFGIATFAALASLLSGMLTDRLNAAAPYKALWVVATATVITIPCVVYGALTAVYAATIAAFALYTTSHMFVHTPGYAMTLLNVPAEMRGTTTALMLVASNLLGYGAGPQFVGLLSDSLQPVVGTDSLRYAIVAFVLLNAWGAAHWLRASHWLRREAAEPPLAGQTTLAPAMPDARH